MSMHRLSSMILAVSVVCCAVVAQAITIDTVPVGNAGNVADPATGSLYGAVSYNYRIGTYEVSNAQYTAFLNAVAQTDTYGLYNSSMGSSSYGGIKNDGTSGPKYYTKDNMADKPVNYVSWYDTLRFANWMTNGQPIGAQGNATTEQGSYTLTGATTVTYIPDTTQRSTWAAGSKTYWMLPSEDEWYKSAYYKGGSTNAGYFPYPTGDTVKGTTGGTAAGTAVFYDSVNAIYPSGTADVNKAGGLSAYGTMGQGGNVWEWNEALIAGSSRGLRGGYWSDLSNYLAASSRFNVIYPAYEDRGIGFRVASVPEPGSLIMLAGFALTALLYWWRKYA